MWRRKAECYGIVNRFDAFSSSSILQPRVTLILFPFLPTAQILLFQDHAWWILSCLEALFRSWAFWTVKSSAKTRPLPLRVVLDFRMFILTSLLKSRTIMPRGFPGLLAPTRWTPSMSDAEKSLIPSLLLMKDVTTSLGFSWSFSSRPNILILFFREYCSLSLALIFSNVNSFSRDSRHCFISSFFSSLLVIFSERMSLFCFKLMFSLSNFSSLSTSFFFDDFFNISL